MNSNEKNLRHTLISYTTVPEIVSKTRIIKFFDIVEGEVKFIKKLNILKYANVGFTGFTRFSYFKVSFCSELQRICRCEEMRSAIERHIQLQNLKFPIMSSANSLC